MLGPQMCGGVSQNFDENAPKTIKSDKMVFFKAESALHTLYDPDYQKENHWINHISAYAAPVDGGCLITLTAGDRRDRNESTWAFVKENIFPGLAALVKEADLAAANGRRSFVYGLPENFGGSVLIKYDSGEKIDYANNQSPVFGKDFAAKLYELFLQALKGERVQLPDAGQITAVKFHETRMSSYTHAELTPNADGTYNMQKIYKFDDSPPSEYNNTVSADVLEKIKDTAQKNAVLIWSKLPKSEFDDFIQKTLTFVLDSGEEIVVKNDRAFPGQLSGAFYAIERELLANYQ